MTDTLLVTGAGGGLGRAIARRFAADGVPVVCVDLDAEAARRTADDTGSVAHGVDITDESAVMALRARLADAGLLPSCLINAAGVLVRRQLADTDAATFSRVLDVNVTGAFTMTRAFAADLIASGRGRIINIASIAGTTGYQFPAYAASKAALINLTRSLLVDFWGTGVTVNAVCPGAMDTPMLDRSAFASFQRRTPTRRVATPDEVAGVCAFLASEDAAAVNGQSIVVDGGATAVFRYTDQESA
ncbi:SDR family NAD(P)-dependent oxidoreductase [Amycolatopsis thermoflava]|uniref:SDR family NAD(P)-dependent oxidoreductase n=1 Tax=Amycolatopsis thermoflava TaxID=84480 RepID=UPI003D73AC7E